MPLRLSLLSALIGAYSIKLAIKLAVSIYTNANSMLLSPDLVENDASHEVGLVRLNYAHRFVVACDSIQFDLIRIDWTRKGAIVVRRS